MDIGCSQTFCIILSNILKHNLIEDFLHKTIAMFQKEVLTFNISTKVKTSDIDINERSVVILNDNDVNKVFGFSLKNSK